MFSKNKLLLILFCALILISMSSVCAADVNQTSFPGSYDDLKDDIQNIHSGDVYNITTDYKFDGDGQIIILNERIITIDQDNVVINGNGHTIDAGGSKNFAIFKILGNNVTISNLTFTNSVPDSLMIPVINPDFTYRYAPISSPVCWQGDNGVMKDCTFSNDCSVNGGAMTWTGNNGCIDNCVFINNTAKGAGGALYIGGANNTVSNCVFINSTSLLTGEAIYVDRNRKNVSFTNFTYTNKNPIIDGSVYNIDVDYLFYTYNIYAYGDIYAGEAYRFDVIPLLYKSIIAGGVNDITDNVKIYTIDNSENCVIISIVDDVRADLKYYAQYLNETGVFLLNIAAYEELTSDNFRIGMDYLKSLGFSNITDLNQVFDSLIHGNYTVGVTQNQIAYVSSERDYVLANGCYAFGKWFDADKSAESFVNNLKVIFTEKLSINCDYTWKPQDMGYNTIVIMGNGSTISGNAKDRDEKKWVSMDAKSTFMAADLTVKNFNTAVECLSGTCYFSNVKFDNNRMDYIIDRDWGAAILNTGYVICDSCTFTNNYAKNGGAIFNQGVLELNNITFKDNAAYGLGNDVCVGDGGIVRINGVNITKDSSNNLKAIAGINFDDNMTDLMSHVVFAESMSARESAFISAIAVATSTVAGIVAGAFTANPFVGVGVGFAVGAVLGAAFSGAIISQHYDVNYNRLKTVLTTTIECAIAGAIAGAFSGEACFDANMIVHPNDYVFFRYGGLFAVEVTGTLVFSFIGSFISYVIND